MPHFQTKLYLVSLLVLLFLLLGTASSSSPSLQIASKFAHTCVLLPNNPNTLKCFGRGLEYQLGQSTARSIPGINTDAIPDLVQAFPAPIIDFAVGEFHTCSLVVNSSYCWGQNSAGQTGLPASASEPIALAPSPLVPSGTFVLPSHIVAGECFTCVVDMEGTKCTGCDPAAKGQVGLPSGWNLIPGSPTSLDVAEIDAGRWHLCYRQVGIGHEVFCLGDNENKQLGISGDTAARSVFTRVSKDFISISVGSEHTCGIDAQNNVLCWVYNGNRGTIGFPGLVKVGIEDNIKGKVDLGDAKVQEVSAGADHTCVVYQGSLKIVCWGSNAHGQLGVDMGLTRVGVSNADLGDNLDQVDLEDELLPLQISTGKYFTCSERTNNQLVCFGSNFRVTVWTEIRGW